MKLKQIFKRKKKFKPYKWTDERRIIRHIRTFLDFEENQGYMRYGITNIVLKKNRVWELHITLERPGLLIGVHGEKINKLQEYLKGIHSREFKIKIYESRLWL